MCTLRYKAARLRYEESLSYDKNSGLLGVSIHVEVDSL
jgi:hypothetical protein